MEVLRTPDERFENLPGYDYKPHYLDASDQEGGSLRIHYLDQGDPAAEVVLCLHGEPSWSYLYRKMIPIFVDAGYRVIAPDLVGFGRSDKPASRDDHTYQRHVDWMKTVLQTLNLNHITLVCQDWGGLIGLRLAAEEPDRFDRIVASNTGFTAGELPLPEALQAWREFSRTSPTFDVAALLDIGTVNPLSPEVKAAYDAPFPDDTFKAGARKLPSLIPTSMEDPAAVANKKAWEVLTRWEKPFLTAFSDQDPFTKGGEVLFTTQIPGAQGQPHTIIKDAGHFLQEDKGEELAKVVVDFMRYSTSSRV